MKADDVNLPNFKYCKKEEMEIKEGVALNSLIVLLIKTNVNVCTSKLQNR
jgi:hypothetical protein